EALRGDERCISLREEGGLGVGAWVRAATPLAPRLAASGPTAPRPDSRRRSLGTRGAWLPDHSAPPTDRLVRHSPPRPPPGGYPPETPFRYVRLTLALFSDAFRLLPRPRLLPVSPLGSRV